MANEGSTERTNNLGLAVTRTGDEFLYTNRQWSGDRLLPDWGPIRKFKLPETEGAPVEISFVTS